MIKEIIDEIYEKFVKNNYDYEKAYLNAKKLNQIDAFSTISIMILIIILFISLFNLYKVGLWIVLIFLIQHLIYQIIGFLWRKNTLKIFYSLYEKADEKISFLTICVYYKEFKGIRKSFLIPLAQILVSYGEYNLALNILNEYRVYSDNEKEIIIGIKLQLYYHLHLKTEFSKFIEIRNSLNLEKSTLLVKTLFKYTQTLEEKLYSSEIENQYFENKNVKYLYIKLFYELDQYCYCMKKNNKLRSIQLLKNLKSYGKEIQYQNVLNGRIHEN